LSLSAYLQDNEDTIVALATAQGIGAIGVIRLSGPEAFTIVNKVFKGKNLEKADSHTIHFGTIRNGEEVLDEVLVSIFRGPKSYTKEDVIEISCHGSPYILQRVIKLLLKSGARLAKAGEFTRRAFLNGQFDLAQAEAVADLINSDSEAAHMAAMNQMRGGFSHKIQALREELIHFASMIELELDFGEEDVEFADRSDLRNLINRLITTIDGLIDSFAEGNVIKNGVPTVIAGKPNAGKSTLLNALLNEEKAIVSDIPGTTRDFIEDEIHIDGVLFRFIDTAGIREAKDKIEAIGVERTKAQMQKASLIIYLFDLTLETVTDIHKEINVLENLCIPFIKAGNKVDLIEEKEVEQIKKQFPDMVLISAGQKAYIEDLKKRITEVVQFKHFKTGDTIVTNIRHYDNLMQTREAINAVSEGLDNQVTNDFLALDIRNALHHLGEITGEITTDDLLSNIFSKFCIGK
jgi:tRNA modification GTPase